MIKLNSNLSKFLLMLLVTCTTSVVSAVDEIDRLQEMFIVAFPPAAFIECAGLKKEARKQVMLYMMAGVRADLGQDSTNQANRIIEPIVNNFDTTIDLCARTLIAEKAAIKVEGIARTKRTEARRAVAMTSPKDVEVVKLAQETARYARELRIRAVRAKELQDQAIAVFPAAVAAIVRKFMNS